MKAISLAKLEAGSMAIYAEEDDAKQATHALLRRLPHRVILRYQAARFRCVLVKIRNACVGRPVMLRERQ
jgi:hypothetical protein